LVATGFFDPAFLTFFWGGLFGADGFKAPCFAGCGFGFGSTGTVPASFVSGLFAGRLLGLVGINFTF
jgi:hypothetical protein